MSDAKLDKCREWIELALGASVTAVIYRNPALSAAPRPALPYVAIAWGADVALGATPYEYTQNEDPEPHPGNADGRYFDGYRRQRRRRTLEIAVYGDTALDLLLELRASLRHVDESALIRAAGLGIAQAGDILDTTTLRDTAHEIAASQDYYVYYTHEDDDPVGVIETLKLTGIDGVERTIDVDPPPP